MTNTPPEPKPLPVPATERAKQEGDAPRRPAGAQPAVWTERMLTAHTRGMKGNPWFSLIDKVYAERTLAQAWEKVRTNAGGSGVDRITQTALRLVIEPLFEHPFAEHSYGFRPGRGCKDALRHVLALIRSYLDQEVMEELTRHEPTDRGTPQGAVISPLLANIYLDPLDHHLAKSGVERVRYADDFVILCRSEEEAKAALTRVQTWVAENGLTLHPEKTRTVDMSQPGGFDFLGYPFERGYRWPRRKAMDRLKDKVRELPPRTSGESLEATIKRLNQMLRGWYGYFQHSHRTTFPQEDGYVRGRLRSILRKRAGKRGRGRCADHQQWRNHYFTELGLFSLQQAHALACQSR